MSDPPRLLTGGADDFEREILGAWQDEQPSEGARAKALAIAGSTAIASGALAAKTSALGVSGLAPKAGVAGGIALLKWLALGALGLVIAGVMIAYLHPVERPASTFTPSVVTVPPPAPVPAAPPLASSVVSAAPSSAVVAPPRHPPIGEHVASHANEPLGEQVAALDRARRSLAGGDPANALRQLDDFDARFSHGALAEEAAVLRVEALLAADDRAAATRAGNRFLAAHPSSPHCARVRALLGQTPADR